MNPIPMPYTTLITAPELQALRAAGAALSVFDCSFDLADPDPEAGRAAYRAAHVPGARYLHLDADLSAAKTGRNGRHPLPAREVFAQRLAAWGVNAGDQVVVYDGSGGMLAARAWWMLRWAGHRAAALLDGGLGAWRAAGLAVDVGDGPPPPRPGDFALQPSLVRTVERQALLDELTPPRRLIIDARAADRFRGENETLDAVGGHIPGARNRFFRLNLDAQGRFKPAATLRAEWESATGGRPPAELVCSCGSGVTACHNLLALEVAGLGGAALYPGSWSEWSAWPGAPIAVGDEPVPGSDGPAAAGGG